ncbi:MAG: CPBP family intramembrane metalloprotease [Myxococcales bacterium]|nr:CPBP family intramembrane metalloprotease [Myxococcales bacterium]
MSRLRAFVAEFDPGALLAGWLPATMMAWCCFCDWKLLPRTGRMLAAGYDAIYLFIPLAFLAAWGATRRRGALAGAAILVSVLVAAPWWAAKLAGEGKSWAEDDPARFFPPLVLAAVVSVAAWMASDVRADDYGIGLGDWRWWGPKVAIAAAIIVPASFLAVALLPSLRAYYPQDVAARADFGQLLAVQLLRGVCLFGEEFFWHGVGLFAIARTHGKRAAILYVSLGYFLLHRGKPEIEMLSSFVGSALLAVVCLRCRSFLPAFLGHWPMNFGVEIAAYLMEGPR